MLNGTWRIKDPFSGQVLNSYTFYPNGSYQYWSQNAGTIISTYTINGNIITYANGRSQRCELSGNDLFLGDILFTMA